uniref:J domain-containing protein n=1 Tax=Kwoniella dejecticola CBS 10117 TaxID=1296121 RepID=A0A1A6AHG4_9TREE|nr:uncharacterized protein I303_01285 [Kwoniella dejecticola CBS 10117]OBR89458.1 hypothetical protein I303_01285 [Kwoniella dejecticola CBS 10117]
MSTVLTPLLWSFLPGQISHQILPYLSSFLPGLFPPSPRDSPKYLRNYRIAFTGVVSLYLAYTLYKGEDTQSTAEDYYALLGVSTNVDDDGLKKAYRTLSRLYHPDRAGSGDDTIFILIRRAYETLNDPIKRYAYDRFGPQILDWKAASMREYIITGLNHSIGFYIYWAKQERDPMSVAKSANNALLAEELTFSSICSDKQWRHTFFCVLLLSELTLILSPTSSFPISHRFARMFHKVFPILGAAPFMQIAFLHRLFTTISIAINQLTSVWCPSPASSKTTQEEWNKVIASLRQLEMESVTSFQGEIVPLLSSGAGDPKSVEFLIQSNMEDLLVERSISSHPQIRQAYQAAMTKPIPRNLRQMDMSAKNDARRPNPDLEEMDQLEIARLIPLPPSPPPSPPLRPIR